MIYTIHLQRLKVRQTLLRRRFFEQTHPLNIRPQLFRSSNRIIDHLHESDDRVFSILLAHGNVHFVVFKQHEPFTEVTSLEVLSLSHTFGKDDVHPGTCRFFRIFP